MLMKTNEARIQEAISARDKSALTRVRAMLIGLENNTEVVNSVEVRIRNIIKSSISRQAKDFLGDSLPRIYELRALKSVIDEITKMVDGEYVQHNEDKTSDDDKEDDSDTQDSDDKQNIDDDDDVDSDECSLKSKGENFKKSVQMAEKCLTNLKALESKFEEISPQFDSKFLTLKGTLTTENHKVELLLNMDKKKFESYTSGYSCKLK